MILHSLAFKNSLTTYDILKTVRCLDVFGPEVYHGKLHGVKRNTDQSTEDRLGDPCSQLRLCPAAGFPSTPGEMERALPPLLSWAEEFNGRPSGLALKGLFARLEPWQVWENLAFTSVPSIPW
jgi:hypothetical protein